MTRIPLLAAFLVGTLCGGVAAWRPREAVQSAPHPTVILSRADGEGSSAAYPEILRFAQDNGAAVVRAGRNLFAFVEPPPAPQPEKPPVLETRAVSAAVALPKPVAPTPPAFPYRYVGNFGPPAMMFAVFVREGEVIDARVGDVLAREFTLRRIGLESVDLAVAGWDDVRVPLTAR